MLVVIPFLAFPSAISSASADIRLLSTLKLVEPSSISIQLPAVIATHVHNAYCSSTDIKA